MSGVQTLIVAADEADLRLDRWFKRHFPTLTHGRLEKLLRTGQIRVDGKRAASNLRLIAGAAVRVPPLPLQPAPPVTEPRPVSARDVRDLQASVLYKDDDMLAIDKPAGLAVQGGSNLDRHLDAMLDVLSFGAAERPRLVHRLDRDTSGVLLLARNARAAAALAEAFRDKTSRKTYWAIVVGVPKIRQGRIDLPLAKLPGRAGERVVPDEDGKSAVTEYHVLDHAGQKAAWLEMWPLTGRTHQPPRPLCGPGDADPRRRQVWRRQGSPQYRDHRQAPDAAGAVDLHPVAKRARGNDYRTRPVPHGGGLRSTRIPARETLGKRPLTNRRPDDWLPLAGICPYNPGLDRRCLPPVCLSLYGHFTIFVDSRTRAWARCGRRLEFRQRCASSPLPPRRPAPARPRWRAISPYRRRRAAASPSSTSIPRPIWPTGAPSGRISRCAISTPPKRNCCRKSRCYAAKASISLLSTRRRPSAIRYESVLQAADLVAIPTRPYGHDLNAANATAELARQAGKPFVFIVNGAPADAELPADLVMTLAQFGPVATTSIPRSLAFVDAMIEGRTVSDSGAEEAAAGTIAQLWKYLAKKLPKAGKAGRSKSLTTDAAAAVAPSLFTPKAPTRKAETMPHPDEASAAKAADDSGDEAGEPEAAAPVLSVPAKRSAPPKQEQVSEPVIKAAPNPPPPQAGRRKSRWRLVKFGLAAAASLVLLAGVAAIIAVMNIDPRTYAGLVTTAVEEATGRKLVINGNIDIALGLTPGVVIEDITLSNAKWSQQPLMASAKRLEVEIRLLPLLFGDVKIRRIILSGAQVNLERAADGKDNWTFATNAEPAAVAPADATAESSLPEIHQIRIEDSKLVFDDRGAKEHREAEIKLLKLTADGLDRTLEFDLAGAIDGRPLKADGEIDSLEALMTGGDLAIDVKLQSGESRLAAEGGIEAPYFAGDIDLNVEGSGPTLAEIGRPFGIVLADRGPFKISGALSGGAKQYNIDALDATVAQSDLQGQCGLGFPRSAAEFHRHAAEQPSGSVRYPRRRAGSRNRAGGA